ncbi:hypothetical protein [Streptomyces sp. B4I13]|nr:hypothetical protein [Streptomyces sp. B4I13]
MHGVKRMYAEKRMHAVEGAREVEGARSTKREPAGPTDNLLVARPPR